MHNIPPRHKHLRCLVDCVIHSMVDIDCTCHIHLDCIYGQDTVHFHYQGQLLSELYEQEQEVAVVLMVQLLHYLRSS